MKNPNLFDSHYEHLQFAEKLIDYSDILQSVKTDLQNLIERIKERSSDSTLYLAVVGEFSSGKSTFINALLRDDLLKTSALVTTATATRLCHGNNLTVEVCLQGSKTEVLRTQPNGKNITVPWLTGIKNLDNRQFIHALTSQDKIAQCVNSLTITHPSSFLANHITIIDTPGTNANSQHEAITKQVLDLEADAAIIVIPANIPLSQTLVSFLSSSLRPFLHRCMFVVTRIDQIREKEISRLLNNLRSRLVNQLGIEPPILYTCSAQVSLDLLTGEEPVREDLKVWGERFTTLEKIINDRLHQERNLSINESIQRLLTQLFEQLEYHLKSQWEHYQVTQDAIQNETILDLDAFSSSERSICHRILEDAALPVRLQVDKHTKKHQKNIISKLKKVLFGAENESALKSIIETESKSIIQKEQEHLHQNLLGSTQNLSQAMEDAGQRFDREFSAAYSKLEVLSGKVKIRSGFQKNVLKINVSNLFSTAQSLNQELSDKDDGTAMKGLASGIAIGSAIMPGIGTLIGGAAGFIASVFFMPSLDQRKQQIWESLESGLDNYFAQVRTQSQEAIETYKQNSITALDNRIDSYINLYKEAVSTLLEEQKTELKRLSDLQESIQKDLSEIAKRQKDMKSK